MESRDLVQSVMMESLKDLGAFEYRTEGAFLHWLSTLAERKIVNKAEYLRAAKRDASREGEVPGDLPADTRNAPSPGRRLEEMEDLLRLEAAIRKLPRERSDLVVMAKLEGMSYAEIARETGKTEDGVRMAVARAVADLAKDLA